MASAILLVEDEPSLSGPLAFLLKKEGFDVTVVEDGQAAVDTFDPKRFDLVLLDLMLPKLSGTEVCRQIRAQANTPIIMVTAKDSEIDIVVGLELGADDYVTKPYSTRELLARMRAVLRRRGDEDAEAAPSKGDGEVFAAEGIELDLDRHVLRVRGKETPIPLREFELLELLMRNAGIALSRSQLIALIWGTNYYGDTKTLDVHIKRLRSRIEEDPANPKLITTIRGVGYRFG